MLDQTTLDQLTPLWKVTLRGENRRPATITTYTLAVHQLDTWLTANRHSTAIEAITTTMIRRFIGDVLIRASSATAKQRYSSLSQFFQWATIEDLIAVNPMVTIKPPKVIEAPIRLVTEPQLKAMLNSCDDSFTGRRDRAILTLLWETGMRLGEISSLEMDDQFFVNEFVFADTKGGGIRKVRLSEASQAALSRYLTRRVRHPQASLTSLWLGKQGKLGPRGISQLIERRGTALGIDTHPHAFRHSFADRFLAAGGSEGDLMRLMGWSNGSRQLLDRYGRAGQEKRADEAYRRIIG